MKKLSLFTITMAGMALFLVWVAPAVGAQAQAGPPPGPGPAPESTPEPMRVGVVVRVESPGVLLDEPEVAAAVLRQVHESLGEAKGIVLVAQDELAAVQKRLAIAIGGDSPARQIRALMAALKLDRLVVIGVTVSDHFKITLGAVVFNPRGKAILATRIGVAAPKFDGALERAVRALLDRLIPALVR